MARASFEKGQSTKSRAFWVRLKREMRTNRIRSHWAKKKSKSSWKNQQQQKSSNQELNMKIIKQREIYICCALIKSDLVARPISFCCSVNARIQRQSV